MASFDSFQANWLKRLKPVVSAGIDPDRITRLRPIIQQDYQKLQRGEEPMDNATAIAAMVSILRNQPVLTEPENPGGIMNVVGNVAKDVAGIVTSLNPVNIVRQVWREGEAVRDLVEGDTPLPSGGNVLQNLAATPGIRFLPGISTLANLTSEEGRSEIAKRPVSAGLDIAPLAGAALKVGAAGAAATGVVNRGNVVAKLAQQKVLTDSGKAALIPDTARLSTTEAIYAAAAQGKPVGAVLAASGMKPLLDSALNPVTQWLKTSTQLSRLHSVELRKAQAEINAFNSRWNEVWEKMPADERVQLGKEWSQPDLYPAATPEHRLIIDEGRQLQRTFAAQGVGSGDLIGVNVLGKDFFYPRTGKVARAIERKNAAENRLSTAIDDLDVANTELKHANNDPTFDPLKKLALIQTRQSALKRLNDAKSAAATARMDRLTTILDTAPADFYPMLKDRIHKEAVARVTGDLNTGKLTRPEFDAAMKRLELGDYVPVFGKTTFDKLVGDIERTWTDLVTAGFEPVFLHNVPTWRGGAVTRGKVIATQEFKPGQFKEKHLADMSPEYSDVAVGLSAGASEYVNKAATERFINDHIIPRGLTYDEAIQAAMPAIERLATKKGLSLVQAKDQVLNSMFAKVDNPEAFGFSSVRAQANMAGRTLYFDKATFDAAKKLTAPRTPKTKVGEVSTKVNSIFKASLFTLSPRHFADELFGNTFLLATTGSLDTFKPSTIRRAIEMSKTDSLPDELSRGVDIVPTDELYNVSMGKTAGRMFKAVRADSVQRANEFVNKVQKSMSFIGEEGKLLRQGYSPELARDLAIRHANDALVDFDSMLPIERTIIRQVFPFYSWTRFIATFLAKYPADHPYRAAFFSRIAAQESDDEATGLPRYFRNLMLLGSPDENGNVRAVDLRVMNPLRDSGNLMSWAGFASSLSPLVEVPLSAMGVDTLAGTPEMFPELTFNPESGRLEARRTNLASKAGVMELLGQFIPPAQTIDHFITVTDRLKRLKATDPVGYRRQLFSALGVPFVPYQESISKAQSRQQKAITEAARATISRSTRQNGSTRDLRRYAVVPWQGQIVSGEGLANLIDRLHSVSSQSGIPTRMLMDEVAKIVT